MADKKYKCNDCDELFNIVPSTKLICLTCGCELILVETPTNVTSNNFRNPLDIQIEPTTANNTSSSPQVVFTLPSLNTNARANQEDFLDSLFEILGEDLREAIEQSIRESSPSHQISKEYLKTLGKVIVDERLTILHDITLQIGPLKVMCASAAFGALLPPCSIAEKRIVVSDPIYGESSLLNNEDCKDSFIIMNRGKVTFASKAITALRMESQALIVTQTMDIWPFVMTDNSNELADLTNNQINILPIPIVMISKKDTDLLMKLLKQTSIHTATLCFNQVRTECSICQENMQTGEEIYKLPCRHAYHVDCVTTWLTSHHTCPLCRVELPSQEIKQTLKNNTNENDNNRHMNSYFN
eukprot:gene8503-11495_t